MRSTPRTPGFFALAAAAVASLAAGCASGGGKGAKADPAALYGGWALDRIDGQPVAPPAGGRAPNMTITSDGKITGYGGVNRFSGTLELAPLAEGGFVLGPVASTKMAGPPEAMRLEDSYFAALQRASAYTVGEGGLTLLEAKNEVLHFVRR